MYGLDSNLGSISKRSQNSIYNSGQNFEDKNPGTRISSST